MMEMFNSIKDFFVRNPVSQFTLKTLNGYFGVNDIYPVLLKLEKDLILIRSKISINGKPVTHWQLKGIMDKGQNFDNKPLPHNLNNNCYYESHFVKKDNQEIKENLLYNSQKHPLLNGFQDMNTKSSLKTDTTDYSRIDNIDFIENGNCKRPPRRLIIKKESSEIPILQTDEYKQPIITAAEKDDTKSKYLTREPPKNPLPKIIPNYPNRSSVGKTEIPKKQVILANNDRSKEITLDIEKNPVSILYEFGQQKGVNCQINILDMKGPSHKPIILMQATLDGRTFDSVQAPNKKECKKLAAEVAIKKLISEGHFPKNLSKSLVQSALKKDSNEIKEQVARRNNVTTVEKIASLVCNELTVLLRDLSYESRNSLSGRMVIAGIVMQDEIYDTFRVVALATGNRCISGDKISLQGKVVNDCHAEIVARRSFMLFIYQQLSAYLATSEESLDIFDEHQEDSSLSIPRRFKIKSNIKFHLYVSTAPCGDSVLFCAKDNNEKNMESEIILSNRHNPTFEHPVQGLLRSKIEGGEGTIPVLNTGKTSQRVTLDGILRGERLKTMSCSDKIAKWNYVGLQGSLLTQFLDPVYLASVILGSMYDPGHLSRAVCCRLDQGNSSQTEFCDAVNHPELGYVNTSLIQKEGDKRSSYSVNWSYGLKLEIVDGVSGQLTCPEKESLCSRIAKASLFHRYLTLFRSAGLNPSLNCNSYGDAKQLSTDYEEKKEKLYEILHRLEYGSWIRKPSEQNDFKDNLYN